MAMMKHFLLVFAWTAALLGQGVAQAQASKTDYRPIVGSNGVNSGFMTIQTPTSLQSANLGTSYAVKRIDYEVFGDTAGRMKFFLPPGTVAFNANLYYYYVFQEGKVALRFNETPSTPLSSISVNNAGGPVNETVLRNLVNGQDVLYYSAGAPANSLVLSSPENPIEPMAKGGYVYGNYQYPGDILQRGLLQVFVKADCYEQWFNSANTQWDGFGNPDENAMHTCEGSENPGNALKDVTLSPSSTLQVGSAITFLTINPNPADATLPACVVEDSANVYVSIDNTTRKISLLPAASNLTSSTTQTIACGSVRKTLTVLPADNGVRIVKSAPTTDGNGNLVLNLKLIRPESDVAGKSKTSYWVAARIPADGFFFKEDEWFFLTPHGWDVLTLPNPNAVAYQANQAVKTETSFTISTDLPAADLGAFNVDLHFGYQDEGGNFQNKGAIWSKN